MALRSELPGAPQSIVTGLVTAEQSVQVVVETHDIASWLCLGQGAGDASAGAPEWRRCCCYYQLRFDTKLTSVQRLRGRAVGSRPNAAAPMLNEIRNRVIEVSLGESRG